MFAGNANLPIGVLPCVNQEIGVPRFAEMQFSRIALWDFETVPVGSPCQDASFAHGGRWAPFLQRELQAKAWLDFNLEAFRLFDSLPQHAPFYNILTAPAIESVVISNSTSGWIALSNLVWVSSRVWREAKPFFCAYLIYGG